ncbi:MAG: hypothetical protein BGO78_17055 [Chloroflexi bacterium 44-23]|nr:MAG: hypothetical protein BGO78_17055 [Chloroflexi bacterium 44-23]
MRKDSSQTTKDFVRVHIFVEGRVQGVGFRYFTLQKANLLGITGWVRNTYRGEVEILAEDTRPKLETLIGNLRQGPGGSFVSNLRIEWLDATEEFDRFSVISSN